MPKNFELNHLISSLPSRRICAQKIQYLETCGSTNDWLKESIKNGSAKSGQLVVAGQQTSGRGRRSQDWWSGQKHANLTFSLAIKAGSPPPQVVGLIAALAIIKTIKRNVNQEAIVSLKWPNDVLINNSKVAGILCELVSSKSILIVGIGININSSPKKLQGSYEATHLAKYMSACSITTHLQKWLWQFEKDLLQYQRCGVKGFESTFISYLKSWAPNGVAIPTYQVQGALIEYSVESGLALSIEGSKKYFDINAITELLPL